MRLTLACFIACWILVPAAAWATHLRGGEITIRKLNCGTAEYEVTLTLYTNTGSALRAGGGILSFGDGSNIALPELESIVIDAQYRIGKAVFITIHTFDKPGDYIISYTEENRNAGIVNMKASVDTKFYIQTELIVNPLVACNHPPVFNIPPIDKACSGKAFFHNPDASDPDGDSLTYEISIPQQSATADVNGFLLPNDRSFYSGFDFNHANESKTGPPLFQLNAITGDLIWDAPGKVGEYEVAIKVTEWRKVSDEWIIAGYAIRDMQIIVEDCSNSRPLLVIPENKCVAPGDNLSYAITGSDPDGDPVKIEVFTADNYGSSPPIITGSGTVQPAATSSVGFGWTIACDQVRDEPYKIVFKITDQPPSGVRLVTFYTWTISVIGRAPEVVSTTLDLSARTLRLDLQPYNCSVNAPLIEVWRRVGEPGSLATNCIRGLPRSFGFSKIGEVTNGDSFVDRGLDPGAKYCYRFVAIFQHPHLSKSESSIATCIGPIVADAPVLTNVSVLKTDNVAGEIAVKWLSPFQIDKIQFPPPYLYDVFRTSDGKAYTKVADKQADTTFLDRGLNTTDILYGYKAVIYSPQGLTHENPVDTSALGFYPRLTPTPQDGRIYLKWDAVVPWSNQSQKFPWHYIYRKQADGNFVLIDSVDVNLITLEAGFEYTDKGVFGSQKLRDNIVYRYKIQTRGIYGNPAIREPLVNFSNECDAQMKDTSPPCKAVLSIDNVDCTSFLKNTRCDFSDFANTIRWTYDPGCGNDVDHYLVYFRNEDTAEFTAVTTTRDLTFRHALPSFSGCYKIVAVDKSGNVGGESNVVCNENCPNVFIPNVFTPSNHDGVNDYFPGIATSDPDKCPRFVKTMDIRIYDRWGDKVYSLTTAHRDETLEWNGRDANGGDLPAGVYYYIVETQFDAWEAANRKREHRGWVNLIR
jgi:gliding motility-associated-like protein